MEKGNTVVEYEKPTPGAGKHRYVFLVLKQADGSVDIEPPSGRASFSVKDLQARHGLSTVAAAFYYCQQDETRKPEPHPPPHVDLLNVAMGMPDGSR